MANVTNLVVTVNNRVLLNNISCALPTGTITSFIGKSGAGKTTLLKALTGLVPLTSGSCTINNQQLNTLTSKQRSETIGYVFQEFNLFPQLTALENCIDPLIVHGKTYEQAHTSARSALHELEMQDYANQYPAQLSGGQQQRVAIARALCLNPRMLVLDEPTASLDPANTDILVAILKKLATNGLTVGLASQDMSFVRKIFDRVYYVCNGKIIEFCANQQHIQENPKIQKWVTT